MPKKGMEHLRREALTRAAIIEIAQTGVLDLTVAGIASRAGVSSALAHHYFGSKEQILFASIRSMLRDFANEIAHELKGVKSPLDRVEVMICTSFSEQNFRAETVAAWMNFYVLAQRYAPICRLLRIYQRRLRSNLAHALRPLTRSGDHHGAADRIAALIDGQYLRCSLGWEVNGRQQAITQIMHQLELELETLSSGKGTS